MNSAVPTREETSSAKGKNKEKNTSHVIECNYVVIQFVLSISQNIFW